MGTFERLFGEWLSGRMKAENLGDQKALASRIHDALGGQGEFETVTQKLSKLLNGKSGGESYFFGEENRERALALAQALGVTPEELHQAYQAARACRSLILDPRLPAQTIGYFQEREKALPGRFHIVVPEVAGEGVAAALRDAAREAANHPLVVLAEGKDGPFLQGAEIAHSLLDWGRRGPRLVAEPDLVPEPEPAPPRRFDVDGRPLRPVSREEYKQLSPKHDAAGVFHLVLEPAWRRDEVPSLSVEQVVGWLDAGPHSNERVLYTNSPQVLPGHLYLAGNIAPPNNLRFGFGKDTQVWTEGGRILALGEQAGKVRALFAPHHEVHEPALFALWRELLGPGRNYWALGEEAALREAPELEPFRKAFGEDFWWPPLPRHPSDREKQSREDLERRRGPDFAQVLRVACLAQALDLATRLLRPESAPAKLTWSKSDSPTRSALLALSQRSTLTGPATLRLQRMLAHAAESLLAELPSAGPESLRAVIDPGGGTLWEVRIANLASPARPLRNALRFLERERHASYEDLWPTPLQAALKSNGFTPSELFEGGDLLLALGTFPSGLPGGRFALDANGES